MVGPYYREIQLPFGRRLAMVDARYHWIIDGGVLLFIGKHICILLDPI